MSRYHRNTDDTDEQTTTSVDLDDDVHAALRAADELFPDVVNGAVRVRLVDVDPTEESDN
jgi:hypothetical protein